MNTLIGQFGQTGAKAIGQGQSYTNQAGNWYSSILSGDATKQAGALAPEIGAAKTSAQQQQKQNSIFGGRSGGTAASTSASNDKVHSDITNLLGSLTGSSAGALGSLGSNLLGQGLGALGQQQGAVQQRMENWSHSLFGKGLATATSAAEGYGLTKAFNQPQNNNQNNGDPTAYNTTNSGDPDYGTW